METASGAYSALPAMSATTSDGANEATPIMHTNNSYGDAALLVATNSNGEPAKSGGECFVYSHNVSPFSIAVDHKPSLNHCDIGIVDRDTSNASDVVGIKTNPLEVVDEKPLLMGGNGAAAPSNWGKSRDESMK